MTSWVTSTSAHRASARSPWRAPRPLEFGARWLARHWRSLRTLLGLGALAALAACSTAPMHSSGVSSNQPYFRTEPAPASRPEGLPEFVDHSVGEEEISIEAMSLVGIPYRWGGNTPDSGFDCSGLVKYVVQRAASVNLPRTTSQMEYAGSAITPDQIAPGDLIFFDTDGRPYSHVGIYVGHYRFVNAPSTGGTVRIDYVTNPYWARHFDGIRRVALGHAAPFQSAPLEAAEPAGPATVRTANASPVQRPNRSESVSDPMRAPLSAPVSDEPSTRTDTRDTADDDADTHDNPSGTTLTIPLSSTTHAVTTPTDNGAGTAHPAAAPDDAANSPDPIAQIANLSGAGTAAVPTRAPSLSSTLPSTPAPMPSAPTSMAPATDPIAGFANSKL